MEKNMILLGVSFLFMFIGLLILKLDKKCNKWIYRIALAFVIAIWIGMILGIIDVLALRKYYVP